ncbi:ATP-binding cassette domain-containing protein [Labrys wisconsinensis]|uniref:Ribose transport system ATP-binding protein n=1 Tax=Labrys wisconsinensis TaxID=425677 RepID=A0ABU0J958_9HYPH|nr:ATP-binding cassette domain-containing protein [Labrys wisconsinensis]MDQ0470810.1 ribose transport system ATP-binding protein [Labrys wisconsinensis]
MREGLLSGIARRNELLLALLLLAALAGFGLADARFLAPGNLASIARQSAVIAIVAFAMTAVIIARGIDISVGSTLAFAGIAAAGVYGATGSSAATIVAAVAAGGAVGLVNGALVGFAGISPFIATLATMAFARGLALGLSHASSIPVDDPVLLAAGSADLAGIPVSVLIAALCLALWWFVLTRTVFGRWIHAVGGNPMAARASLVPVRGTLAAVYALAGASAGLGAVVTIGRLGSAQPLAGTGLEFTAITAAIIGGTKLSGGEGSVTGAALGALLLGAINTGLSFMDVPQQVIYLVTGALVLAAVLLSQPEVLVTAWHRRAAPARAGIAAAPSPGGGHRIELVGLGKLFPGVRALDGVSFAIAAGEVVALAGENGAGKSTLVKCLSGVYRPDEGSILVDGMPAQFRSPEDARGISVIHQHFSLAPDLTVLENLFLGRELRRFGLLDRRRMAREARRVIGELGLDIDPHDEIGRLTVGQRQMVEVARAILAEAWLFVMDEPTSALSTRERDRLYGLIATLVRRGAAILYISHKMEEIFTLAQRVVVLRDGRFVGERRTAEIDDAALIAMMVGRDVGSVFRHVETERGDVLVEVTGLSDGGLLQAADLTLRAGEIVALAGLMGSGRSEVLRCIAGLSKPRAGRVLVGGAALAPGSLRAAQAAGIVYVPEDRHLEGFVGTLPVRDNLGLVWMRGRSRLGLVGPRALAGLAADLIAALGVRPAQPGKKTIELSGGNQQKVVIGKWLATEPRVLLLDEPTRGVDVGAKSELHALIARLKARGAAILMVSSELPEVLGVADRILVMHAGRLAGELPRGAGESEVMALAFGRSPGSHPTLQGGAAAAVQGAS